MQHTILLADNDSFFREAACRTLEPFTYNIEQSTSASAAISYLRSHHNETSMVLCDLRVSTGGNGATVLRARNDLDSDLPFYISGRANGSEINALRDEGLDGYLSKNGTAEELKSLVNQVLVQRIEIEKPVILFKIGGSAQDYVDHHENGLEVMKEVLDYFHRLQESGLYQVILTAGAGPRGNRAKLLTSAFGERSPDVLRTHGERIERAVNTNIADLISIIGNEHAVHVKPDEMLRMGFGSEEVRLEKRTWSSGNIAAPFNGEKIVFVSSTPRHFRMGYDDLMRRLDEAGFEERRYQNHIDYPLTPRELSDVSTVLWAHAFGLREIGFLKRTDGVYRFDPYIGFDPRNRDTRGYNQWRKAQRENKHARKVAWVSLLSDISRKDQEEGDHLLETLAVSMIDRLGIDVHLAHIDPQELFPDGQHVIKNCTWSERRTSRQARERHLNRIVRRQRTADILSRI